VVGVTSHEDFLVASCNNAIQSITQSRHNGFLHLIKQWWNIKTLIRFYTMLTYTCNVRCSVFNSEECIDEEKLNKTQLKFCVWSDGRMSDEGRQIVYRPPTPRFLTLHSTHNTSLSDSATQHAIDAVVYSNSPQVYHMHTYTCTILTATFQLKLNHTTGYASQHICCLSQARIKWEICSRKGIWRKNWGQWRWVTD